MTATSKKNYDSVIFWSTGTVYLLFLLFLFASYSHVRLLHNRFTNKTVAKAIFPIRWDLYTRSPLEHVYRLYQMKDGKAERYDLMPFDSKYYFGLKRDYKVLSSEMITIMTDTVSMRSRRVYGVWMSPKDNINKYLNTDTLVYNDISSANILYLRGKYIITEEPAPNWDAARRSNTQVQH